MSGLLCVFYCRLFVGDEKTTAKHFHFIDKCHVDMVYTDWGSQMGNFLTLCFTSALADVDDCRHWKEKYAYVYINI